MKRIIVTILAAAVCCGGVASGHGKPEARNFAEFIKSDLTRAAGTHHVYEPMDTSVTKAPCGYKPVYISHIGRHGSRYQTGPSSFRAVAQLEHFDSLGILTEEGKKLLALEQRVREVHEGHYGELTERGGLEHRQIAGRMARHYPEVFSNPQKTKVITHSTDVGRVLKSRENFLSVISAYYPQINFESYNMDDDPWTRPEVAGRSFTKEERDNLGSTGCTAYTDSLFAAADVSKFMKKTFNVDSVPDLGTSAGRFAFNVYRAAGIRQCLDEEDIDYIEDYYDVDEFVRLQEVENIYFFNYLCISEENRGMKANAYGGPILESMVADADSALAAQDIAATLRFSHDTYLQPLLSLIGGTGNDYQGTFREANSHWYCGESVCMGTNVQMIFFRNRKGHVLVKILHNDREIQIPSLKARKGVFYDWDELKEYFAGRL